jgi:putative transposase
VQDDRHFLTLCRYVESNPVRCERPLAERAELWHWSRLGYAGEGPAVADWPVDRPARWVELVNEPLAERELERLRTSVARGRPYGEAAWTESAAKRGRLQSSLRPRGRPRKVEQAARNGK